MDVKVEILKELNELKKLGVAGAAKAMKALEAGNLEDLLTDVKSGSLGISDGAGLAIDLAGIK